MISLFTEQHYIPRRHRANEAGGLYHALNRGNLRADNFRKVADLSRTTTTSLSFAATSSETPCERIWWIEPRIGVGIIVATATEAHPDPKLLSPWPVARLPKWAERVNDPLTKKELDAVRLSAQRGRPLRDDVWVESIATRLTPC